jgi:plastocyanin
MKPTLALVPLLAFALAFALAPAIATPLACVGECTITGSSEAFILPVQEVQSGSSVVWTSIDIGHTNADGAVGGARCFVASYSAGDASSPVRFDIAGDQLTATTDGETQTCGNAVATPAGAFVLPYYCVIHPVMRGVLVVTA